MKTFSDRVKARRMELGISQATLAKRANLSQSTVAQIEAGRNARSAHILELADALGVTPRWLSDGEDPAIASVGDANRTSLATTADYRWPFPAIPRERIEGLEPAKLERLQGAIALALAQIDQGLTPSRPQQPSRPGSLLDMDLVDDPFPMAPVEAAPWEGGRTVRQLEREGLVRFAAAADVVANVGPGEQHAANDRLEKVPELADVRLAAGDGIENDSELETGFVQFRRSFLQSVGASSKKARVVYAKGDSMAPDIKDGWALLVVPAEGISLHALVPQTIYAINYDGKMLVKSIARDRVTGRWVARSTNAKYPDIPLENGAQVRVLGRVVWAGGLLRPSEAVQWVAK